MSSKTEDPTVEKSPVAAVSDAADAETSADPPAVEDEDTIELEPPADEISAMDQDSASELVEFSAVEKDTGTGNLSVTLKKTKAKRDSLSPVVTSKKKSKQKKLQKSLSLGGESDSANLLLASESMTATVESAVPQVLAHFRAHDPDPESDSEPGDMTPPLGPPSKIRHRLSDQSIDSISSEPSSSREVYTDLKTQLTGPTSLTIKVGGEEVGKIIAKPNPPIERTVSEESGMSDYSIGPLEKACALCNRGEKSLLGQGDLARYDPSPNFNVFKKQLSKLRRASSEYEYDRSGERSPKHLTWRRPRGPPKGNRDRSKSPRRGNSHGLHDADGRPVASVDELSLVGHSEDTDIYMVFERSGHTWAHHCCAAWSEGVIQAEDYSLQFVDKAVLAGLTQKCSYCRRFGATITCRQPKCNKRYHYPCASGGGCFQDIKTLSLLCPDHTDKAETIAGNEALCVVCDTCGHILEQLFCTSCGQHYHGNCLDPPVEVNPVVRAGWQCPDCKICQTCRQPGDDNKMLVCDTCDKGYHTFCLQPVMTTIPKNGWKCKNCRVCGDCGSRTPGNGPSSRWHLNYAVCDSCYQQRNKGLCCPLCGKAYRQFTQKQMGQCNLCKKFVHANCDEAIEAHQLKGDAKEYICKICKNRDPAEIQEMASYNEAMMNEDGSLQDIEGYSFFKGLRDKSPTYLEHEMGVARHRHDYEESDLIHHSQDSLLLTEDSVSSMDLDLQLGVQHLGGTTSGQSSLAMATTAPSNTGSGTTSASHTPSSSPSPRPVAPGIGKPSFGKKLGKKLGAPGAIPNRSRNRAPIGIGKKRQRSGVERKRGRQPKLSKQGQGGVQSMNSNDDDHSSTIVICDSKDEYILQQDICYSCGSLGNQEEGKLVVCSQCGQCYHPYCANMKISKVVLQKGWRCLDCTVCEGCGKPHDEGRLILCDECDISYHIYCLDPPLESVPKGTWKCKWCACCVSCGATTPGINCQWQNNYSQCGPCSSLSLCPICQRFYREEELIVQCLHCERWCHGICDGINSEDDAERAADFGYNCWFCRPVTGHPGPLPPLPPSPPRPASPPPLPPPATLPPPSRDPSRMDPAAWNFSFETKPPKPMKTFFLDGVYVSEMGLNQIKTLKARMMPQRKPRGRAMRGRAGLTRLLSTETIKSEEELPINPELKAITAAPMSMELDDMKPEDTSLEEGEILLSQLEKPGEIPTEGQPGVKKKARVRIGMGVGGFIARHRGRGMFRRGGHSGMGRGGGMMPPQGEMGAFKDPFDGKMEPEGKKKQRRQRIPKKSMLEDNYPSYLQEAFFGRDILDKSQMDGGVIESPSDDNKSNPPSPDIKSTLTTSDPFDFPISPPKPALEPPKVTPQGLATGRAADDLKHLAEQHAAGGTQSTIGESHDEPLADDSDKEHHIDEGALKALLPIGEADLNEILIGTGFSKEAEAIAGAQMTEGGAADPKHSSLEALDMIHPTLPNVDMWKEFDRIDSLEDVFKEVLSPQQSSPSSPKIGDGGFQLPTLPSPTLPPTLHPGLSTQHPGPVHPNQPGSAPSTPQKEFPESSVGNVPPFPLHPGAGPDFHRLPPYPGQEGQPQQQHPPWAQPPPPQGLHPGMEEMETDTISYNKRSMLKWEKDEALGENATISPVLYANVKHPELKLQYTEWSERSKQIAKIWRKVPPDQRAPFLTKARENRASSRLLKTQNKGGQEMRKKKSDLTSPVAMGNTPGTMPPPPVPPQGGGPPHVLQRSPSMEQLRSPQDAMGKPMGGDLSQPHTPLTEDMKDKSTPEADPYAFPPHTPTESATPSPTTPSVGPRQPHRRHTTDIYSHSPATPRPSMPGSQGPSPGSVVSSMDVFRQPAPPQGVSSMPTTPQDGIPPIPRSDGLLPSTSPIVDPHSQSPTTPRMTPEGQDPFAVAARSAKLEDQFKSCQHAQSGGPHGMASIVEGGGAGPPRMTGPHRFPSPLRMPDPAATGSRPPTPRQGQGQSPHGMMDMHGLAPGTPRTPLTPQDPYAQQVPTPRPPQTPTDPYAQQPGTPMPGTSQGNGDFHPEMPGMMPGIRGRYMDPQAVEGPTNELHRQQLKERLALQTKQRVQSKKKIEEQERIMRDHHGQMGPMHNWEESPPGQQYPGGPPSMAQGFSPEGVGPRAPPPGYPMMQGPHGSDMARWHDDGQMVRPPHPGQIRPGMEAQFGMRGPGEMVMRPNFPPGMRAGGPGGPGMHHPQGPGAHPQNFANMSPGSGGPSPTSPYPSPRHPGHMDMCHPMFQERLRNANNKPGQTPPGAQSPSPQGSAPGTPQSAGPQGGPPFGAQGHPLRARMASPVPSSPVEGPFHPMMRPQMAQGQGGGPATAARFPMMHQQLRHQMRPGMPGAAQRIQFSPDGQQVPVRPCPPFQVDEAGRPIPQSGAAQVQPVPGSSPMLRPSMRPPMMTQTMTSPSQAMPHSAAPGTGVPLGPTGPGVAQAGAHRASDDGEKSDDQLEDLFATDGTFNLLEYADPELHSTLTEVHDKSIFDEHLGIKPTEMEEETLGEKTAVTAEAKPTEQPSGSGTKVEQVPVPTTEAPKQDPKPGTPAGALPNSEAAKSEAEVSTAAPTLSAPALNTVTTTAISSEITLVTTTTASESAQPPAVEVPEKPEPQPAKTSPTSETAPTESNKDESVKPTETASEQPGVEQPTAASEPTVTEPVVSKDTPDTPGDSSANSEGGKTPKEITDFQSKFLEFSQRKKDDDTKDEPTSKEPEEGSTKADKKSKKKGSKKSAASSAAVSPAASADSRDSNNKSPAVEPAKEEAVTEEKTVPMQVDGCVDEDDLGVEYVTKYVPSPLPLPVDGAWDCSSSSDVTSESEDDEIVQIMQQGTQDYIPPSPLPLQVDGANDQTEQNKSAPGTPGAAPPSEPAEQAPAQEAPAPPVATSSVAAPAPVAQPPVAAAPPSVGTPPVATETGVEAQAKAPAQVTAVTSTPGIQPPPAESQQQQPQPMPQQIQQQLQQQMQQQQHQLSSVESNPHLAQAIQQPQITQQQQQQQQQPAEQAQLPQIGQPQVGQPQVSQPQFPPGHQVRMFSVGQPQPGQPVLRHQMAGMQLPPGTRIMHLPPGSTPHQMSMMGGQMQGQALPGHSAGQVMTQMVQRTSTAEGQLPVSGAMSHSQQIRMMAQHPRMQQQIPAPPPYPGQPNAGQQQHQGKPMQGQFIMQHPRQQMGQHVMQVHPGQQRPGMHPRQQMPGQQMPGQHPGHPHMGQAQPGQQMPPGQHPGQPMPGQPGHPGQPHPGQQRMGHPGQIHQQMAGQHMRQPHPGQHLPMQHMGQHQRGQHPRQQHPMHQGQVPGQHHGMQQFPGQPPVQQHPGQSPVPHPAGTPQPVQSPAGTIQSPLVQSPTGHPGHSPHLGQSPRPSQSPHQSPHPGQSPKGVHSPMGPPPGIKGIPGGPPSAGPPPGHPGSSPHNTSHSGIMSPKPLQSPHPRPSPLSAVPSPQPGIVQQQVMSPHPGPSPHAVNSPANQVAQSPHPASRSGTPQASPKPSVTPVPSGSSQPTTPITAPTTPGLPGRQTPGAEAVPLPGGAPAVGASIAASHGNITTTSSAPMPLGATQPLTHLPQTQAGAPVSQASGGLPASMHQALGAPGQIPGQALVQVPGQPPVQPSAQHSAIGALLNQQRPMMPVSGQQVVMGPRGPINSQGQPVPAGFMQRMTGPQGQPLQQGQMAFHPRGPLPPGMRLPPGMQPRPGLEAVQGHPQGTMTGPDGQPLAPGQTMHGVPGSQAGHVNQSQPLVPGQVAQRMPGQPMRPGGPPVTQPVHFMQQGVVRQMVGPSHMVHAGPGGPEGDPAAAATGAAARMPGPRQPSNKLLLQEQPLLLEDLLEEEKREQQRQAMMQKQIGPVPAQPGQPVGPRPQLIPATGQTPPVQGSKVTPEVSSQTAATPTTTAGTQPSATPATHTQPKEELLLPDDVFAKLKDDLVGDAHKEGQVDPTTPTLPAPNQTPAGGHMVGQPSPMGMVRMRPPPGVQMQPGAQMPPPGHIQMQRMQHPEQGWPQPGPSDAMGGAPGGFPVRPPTPQHSPRTPSPFAGPSQMVGMPGGPPPVQVPPPQPPPKPAPPPKVQPGQPLTEDELQQQKAYEDWLMQHASYLGIKVKYLQTQVERLRKTKKALATKQRHAKKNGNDLSEPELQTLETTSQEQSKLQKQLETHRKQYKTHQQQIQDYRAKQPERFGWGNMAPGLPGQGMPPRPPMGMPLSQPGMQGMPQGQPGLQSMPGQPGMPQGQPGMQVMAQGQPGMGAMPQGQPGLQQMQQGQPGVPQMQQGQAGGQPMVQGQGQPGAIHGPPVGMPGLTRAPGPQGMMQGAPASQVMVQGQSGMHPQMSQASMQQQQQQQHQQALATSQAQNSPSPQGMGPPRSHPGIPPHPGQQPTPPQQSPSQPQGLSGVQHSPLPGQPGAPSTPSSDTPSPRPLGPNNQPPTSSSAGAMLSPRMPGSNQPIRLPPSARQEYEAYMQTRLRMMSQQPNRTTLVPGNQPQHCPPSQAASAAAMNFDVKKEPCDPSVYRVQLHLQDENNPFSESYQQREHLEKLRKQEQQRIQMARHVEQQKAMMGADDKGPGPHPPMMFQGEGQPRMMMSPDGTMHRFPRPPFPDQGQRMQGPGFMGQPPRPGHPHHPATPGTEGQDPRMIAPGDHGKAGVMTSAAASAFGGPPGVHGMSIPSSQQQAMAHRMMSPPGKTPPPGASSGMSELQKLVNMQPSVAQDGNQSLPTSMISMVMGSGDSQTGLPPASQPVRAHLGQAGDGKGPGEAAGDGRDDENRPEHIIQQLKELKQKPMDQEGLRHHNMLLKKLLATSRARDGLPPEEDDDVSLTPEQQRQLALIDSMPLTMEREWEPREGVPGEPRPELEQKPFPSDNQAPVTKKPRQRKKKQKDGEPGKEPGKKRRKGGLAGLPPGLPGPPPPMPGPPMPPMPKQDDLDMQAISEQILQTLRSLPKMSLQEPTVYKFHSICPISGMGSPPLTGESLMRGGFGKCTTEDVTDLYNTFPYVSKLAKPVDRDSPYKLSPEHAFRRHLIGGTPTHYTGETERYTLGPGGVSTADRIMGILGDQRPRSQMSDRLILPSPPLIESRPDLHSRASDQSPATIVSSSSPELMYEREDRCPFPGLKLIPEAKSDEERERECSSPQVPLVCPIPVKGSPLHVKEEGDMDEFAYPDKEKENLELMSPDSARAKGLGAALGHPLRSAENQMSVTLTLNTNAAENIGGVISAIADLLKIAVPPSYEISRSPSPSPDLYRKGLGIKHKEEAVDIQSLMKSTPKFCRHCDVVVLNSGVRMRKSEIPYLAHEDKDGSNEYEVVFCSMNCYMQFNNAHKLAAEAQAKLSAEGRPIPGTSSTPASVTDATSCPATPSTSRPLTPGATPDKLAPLSVQTSLTPGGSDSSLTPSALGTPTSGKYDRLRERDGKQLRKRSSSLGMEHPKVLVKKWCGLRYKKWEPCMIRVDNSVTPPTEQELLSELEKQGTVIKCPSGLQDKRTCSLCNATGEGETDGPARLLNLEAGKWVHLNCALWSNEVYETMNGALVNADQANKRGNTLSCSICNQKGATVGCFRPRCGSVYHVQCAKKDSIMFYHDKTILCPSHVPKGPPENDLSCLSVFRRVYINREEDKQVAGVIHQEEPLYTFRIGALIIHKIGQLIPHQIQTGRFHTKDHIFPVGYKSTRLYWSFRQINKRCRYVCKILDADGRPEFVIRVVEDGYKEMVLREHSAKAAWMHILNPLEKLRRENDLVKMFPDYVSGEDLFGLTDPIVLRIIESLPGMELLTGYHFKFGRSSLFELPLTINPTGCARSEPKLRTHFKRPHTLHSSSNSRSLPTTVTLIPGDVNSPYMKQFVHSKSQQYRRLKMEWRNNVYLRRSNIQGLGLFAARDLEKHTMVIEYIGELIRNETAEIKEKIYEQQNRGVYMFRIDDNLVVDATMAGGPARYINHSCNPNCVAEVVPFEKDSKIIIIAKRRISRGEELMYDYKFDFEDDQHKIPCLCGAPNCRKWMN